MFNLAEETRKKWQPILEHEDLAPIKDSFRRAVTAQLLENTERELRTAAENGYSQGLLSEASPVHANAWGTSSANAGTGGNIDAFDPILISLVRRSMPNLLAYDICGVQPMSGPTGLIFAMRSRYTSQTGNENFYNEVNTAFSTVVTGANTTGQKNVGQLPTGLETNSNNYNFGSGMSTSQMEALGTDSNSAFAEMAFSIEKVTVTAKGRALKAEYTMELAQDLKAVHGLDAETELSNILSTEILAEINREVVRTINTVAKQGSLTDTATPGVFDLDTDSNGRWSVEKFKGLMFQLEREANIIAKETRRGKGNIVICSADVASALQMAGVLDYTPALNRNDNMQIDDTGNTFAGVLNGRLNVYIDPYAIGGNYLTIGYKGRNFTDAGLFYCPYVPLQMVRAVDPNSFQPKIGFKTRYGMVANPYAEGLTEGSGALTRNANVYYRRTIVQNLM
jgi:hypothetical protein